jgi:hypothetical protein
MFVNRKVKHCTYCNNLVENIYEHLLISHKTKLLKILAIKNYKNKYKPDYNTDEFHYIINDFIIANSLNR